MQIVVELLAGDAGLDDAIEVLGVDGENLVHPGAVERHAAVRRVDVALERGADAERHDRRVVLRAEFYEVDHVVARFSEHDRVRRLVLEPGEGMAVLPADRLRGGEAVAESCGEIPVEGGDDPSGEAAFALADGGKGIGHGLRAFWVLAERAEIRRVEAAWLVSGNARPAPNDPMSGLRFGEIDSLLRKSFTASRGARR